jgi:trans-2,3-dihydro-3-hydroxyanthranilate isomerase
VQYFTADVFTDVPFGGNQLAVLPNAPPMDDERLLAIAREFNYSETVFVYPPSMPSATRKIRIFTPGGELPFAGHPTVGTAHVLAATGHLQLNGDETHIVFEEGVGPVPVRIEHRGGTPTFCELTVAKLPETGPALPSRVELAEMLSLTEGDLAAGPFDPQIVSCGVPFAFVPLRSRDAVRRAKVRVDLWERQVQGTPGEMVFVFAMEAERPGSDVRARMFAPGISVPEDPATGSACAALGGYLGMRDDRKSGTLRWTVEQGFEMGRPSIIRVEADLANGAITGVRVGGASVIVAQGELLA